MTRPTAEQQVAFLGNVQRLLGEGSFVATYKYALLLSLADLSVELGDDTGAPLTLPISAIAERIVMYYWRQALPYPGADGHAILKQNTGRQAKILTVLDDIRKNTGGSLPAARAMSAPWTRLVAEVAEVVTQMPLWKLQRVGDRVLDFLYPTTQGRPASVTLHPGVTFCFRRFHGLIQDLVRGAWVRFVRDLKDNQPILGDTANLDEFLFGSERADLSVYRPILHALQGGQCFYCDHRLDAAGAVDHFIPWSRYPVDLGHNFVLSHATCNAKKGDRLAALQHLERWCQRNHRSAEDLTEAFTRSKILADRVASVRITRWAYEQIESSSGLVWISGEQMAPLDAGWRAALQLFD